MGTSLKFKRPLILYPVLLIALYVLTKIQIREVNPELSEILIFFTINIAALILVFAGLNLFIKDRLKIWLIDFLLFDFILFYNKNKITILYIPIINKFLESKTSNEWHIVSSILFILLIAISTLIIRYKGSLIKISQYLNLLLSFLIAYQLFATFTQLNAKKIKLASQNEIVTENHKPNIDSLPDIYYIILDAYTGNQSLNEYWNFNNNMFRDFLTRRGFLFASSSKTNYNMTPYSLASSLNMSYLKNIPNSPASSAQEKNLINLVSNSSVVKLLLKNDYKVVNYSFFDFPNNPRYYNDFFFLLKENLLDGTIIEPIIEKLNKKWTIVQDTGLISLKTMNLDILNKLKEKNGKGNPLFVYAHIMMPHEPYLFDEYGKTQKIDSALNYLSKDRYLGQLKYLNNLIENTITKIFENNMDKLPVIIIQGDHGWRYLKGENQLKESTTILNAYFFPDQDYRKIYSSISPVNTFRVILNKYLGYKFALLKDTTFNVFIY